MYSLRIGYTSTGQTVAMIIEDTTICTLETFDTDDDNTPEYINAWYEVQIETCPWIIRS